jgi:hypothetical protein
MTAVRLKAQQLNRVRKAAGIGHMPYPGRFRSLLAAARRAPWGPSAPLGRFGRPTFSARLAPKSALPSAPNGLVVLIYPMGPEGVGALRMGLLTSDQAQRALVDCRTSRSRGFGGHRHRRAPTDRYRATRLQGAATAAQRVVNIGRPWLRFLGWWREPTVGLQCQVHLDQYVTWMRDERGFAASTVDAHLQPRSAEGPYGSPSSVGNCSLTALISFNIHH